MTSTPPVPSQHPRLAETSPQEQTPAFRILRLLLPVRRRVLAGAFLLLCLATVSFFRVTASENLTLLIPRKPVELEAQYQALSSAPFMRRLFFTVGGDQPIALARRLEAALRGPEFRWVGNGAENMTDPAGGFTAALPFLLETHKLERLELREEAVVQAVAATKRRLLSPTGIGLRTAAGRDPLNLSRLVFEGRAVPFSMRLEQGQLLSGDGKYVLVSAAPYASMSDSAASAKVMARAEEALKTLPAGTNALVTGGYRHSAVNAEIIKDDLHRVLPASFVGLSILLVFLVRRGAVQVALAPVFALVCAVWGSGLLLGELSGIVLGFGAVLLGISIDYALLVHAAIKASPDDVAGAVVRIERPLLASSMTTCAAFGALLFSTVPLITHTTVFSLIGLGVALLYAMFILPLSLARKTDPIPEPVGEGNRPRSVMRPGAGIWAVSALPVLLFLGLAGHLHFNGDLRALSATTAAMAEDEAAFLRIWAENGEKAFFSLPGDSEEAVLRKAERLDDALNDPRLGAKPEYTLSPALFLPSQERRQERIRLWREFWSEREAALRPVLERAAKQSGFAPEAFSPFLRIITEGSDPSLQPPGAEFARRQMLSETSNGWAAYIFVPASYEPTEAVRRQLKELGGVSLRAAEFRTELSEALSADMVRIGLITLALVLPMVWMVIRKPRLIAAALFPTGTALASVAVFLALQPQGMNFFHAAGIPLVLGLSMNYGIFMVFAVGQTHEKSTKRAVFLCAASSCIGFGSLVLARHPALFSLGATVGIGLATACAAALWVLPSPLFSGRGKQA